MSDRKSKAAFLEVFARELEGCYKGIAWNDYALRCMMVGRKPNREWFDKHWDDIKEKLSDPSDTVDGEKEEAHGTE